MEKRREDKRIILKIPRSQLANRKGKLTPAKVLSDRKLRKLKRK